LKVVVYSDTKRRLSFQGKLLLPSSQWKKLLDVSHLRGSQCST
jgi:hypothetical protein